jgi:hypothetical protein
MAKSSGAVVAATLYEGGWRTLTKIHTCPPILLSVAGPDKIDCAFR